MRIHSNAATTPVTRRQIQKAQGSCSEIARRFNVSRTTIRRWRGRSCVEDACCRPRRMRTAFQAAQEAAFLELRKRGLSLDEVFEAFMDVHPGLCRSSLWRLFRRHGLGRLYRSAAKSHGEFKPYSPGFVHIDAFYTPRFGSSRYFAFVAVDRATRRTHIALYDNRRMASAADFLRQCVEAFEFRIDKVLTDNGTEFTNKTYNRNGRAKATHAFDKACAEFGIRHRLTKPRTPKTNGMAERQIAIVKNATTRAKTYLSPEAMEEDLHNWNAKNNRRRQRRLGYKTPLQVSQEWYEQDSSLFRREPLPKAA